MAITFIEAIDCMAQGKTVESNEGRKFIGNNGQMFMIRPDGKYQFGFGLLEDEVTGEWRVVENPAV